MGAGSASRSFFVGGGEIVAVELVVFVAASAGLFLRATRASRAASIALRSFMLRSDLQGP